MLKHFCCFALFVFFFNNLIIEIDCKLIQCSGEDLLRHVLLMEETIDPKSLFPWENYWGKIFNAVPQVHVC